MKPLPGAQQRAKKLEANPLAKAITFLPKKAAQAGQALYNRRQKKK